MCDHRPSALPAGSPTPLAPWLPAGLPGHSSSVERLDPLCGELSVGEKSGRGGQSRPRAALVSVLFPEQGGIPRPGLCPASAQTYTGWCLPTVLLVLLQRTWVHPRPGDECTCAGEGRASRRRGPLPAYSLHGGLAALALEGLGCPKEW